MKKLVLLVLSSFLIVACSKSQPGPLMLLYSEAEHNVEPYLSRTIITDQFVRMDYNVDDEDFILFDRKAEKIYSVNHSDKTVMEIGKRPVDIESPIALNLSEGARAIEEDAPKISGHPLRHIQLMVNDVQCMDLMVAEKLLPRASQAMQEYLTLLSGEHARILPAIPADMHEPCDLAQHIYAPTRQYSQGFPILERHKTGYSRTLLDYQEDYEPAKGLFDLPKDYRRYTPESGLIEEAVES